ncbi:hypothetical protein [Streptomyces davaonensis]|nr:hypothetical protein [Streptomyces davaonensis]
MQYDHFVCALRRDVPPTASPEPHEYRKALPKMRLFLSDISDVKRLLERDAEAVTIQAGDATAESVDDLRDASKRELRTVRLITVRPEVVVALGESPAVRTTEQSQAALSLVDAVEEMLRPRMSFGVRHRRLVQAATALMTLAGLVATIALINAYKSLAFGILPYLILLGAIALMNRLIDGRAEVVPLLPREQREERLKQQNLIIAGVLSFLGGAAVAALTFYMGWKR